MLPSTPRVTVKLPSSRAVEASLPGAPRIWNLPLPSALPSDTSAGANTAAYRLRAVTAPSTLQLSPQRTFAVPDTVPLSSDPSHSESVMPCGVAMPLAENLLIVISGANGSVKLAAVISVSNPWPLSENFASSASGPRTVAVRSAPSRS
jgi:hypothetical protein